MKCIKNLYRDEGLEDYNFDEFDACVKKSEKLIEKIKKENKVKKDYVISEMLKMKKEHIEYLLDTYDNRIYKYDLVNKYYYLTKVSKLSKLEAIEFLSKEFNNDCLCKCDLSTEYFLLRYGDDLSKENLERCLDIAFMCPAVLDYFHEKVSINHIFTFNK